MLLPQQRQTKLPGMFYRAFFAPSPKRPPNRFRFVDIPQIHLS